MRLSVALLGISLLGILAGGWLTGRLGFGLCVITDSVVLGVLAVLLYDDGKPAEPQVHGVPTLHDVLERARRSA